MLLSNRIDHYFEDTIRSRGFSYFREGRVKIASSSTTMVDAIVEGSSSYSVSLIRINRNVGLDCNCPYFLDYKETCKHIWATILKVEHEDLYSFLNGFPQGQIEVVFPDEEYADELSQLDSNLVNSPHSLLKTLLLPESQGEKTDEYLNRSKRPQKNTGWKDALQTVRFSQKRHRYATQPSYSVSKEKEIIYLINLDESRSEEKLIIEVMTRERKKNGEWGKLKEQKLRHEALKHLPNRDDQEIITLLNGFSENMSNYYYYYQLPSTYTVPHAMYERLLPALCKTGRTWTQKNEREQPFVLKWDDQGAWNFILRLNQPEPSTEKNYTLTAGFCQGEVEVDIDHPSHLFHGGVIFFGDRVARLNDHDSFEWISYLRQVKKVEIPVKQLQSFIESIYKLPKLPPIKFPEEIRLTPISPSPGKFLRIHAYERDSRRTPPLNAQISFSYEDKIIIPSSENNHILDIDRKLIIHRNPAEEKKAYKFLFELGFREPVTYYREEERRNGDLEITASKLPKIVSQLIEKDWHVEAEGNIYRSAGAFNINVTSGIDWFELTGEMDFSGYTSAIPELLKSLKKGSNIVQLGDGSYGILPETWLKKYGLLAGMGEVKGDHVKFKKSQAALLDILLADQPEVDLDKTFVQVRDRLRSFDGLTPVKSSKEFKGTLRDYQKEGLGWLIFLQEFGFGGCLADDMGLGKTVQVLALLQLAKNSTKKKGTKKKRLKPSLVVVPRSLLFNWEEESTRFTPELKVHIHIGADRLKPGDHFKKYDIILTTYGTLRRDILCFKEINFGFAILDEAQAIKNSASQIAKASRLLNADHRLALSGTPIENHIGELWSIFEFLNPGILGNVTLFKKATTNQPEEKNATQLIGQALRPFILRRTKSQVAKDLPEKTEQTIYCEMKPAQRKLYNDLKKHYQVNLLGKVDNNGLGRSKIQVLEALLRLRQASCHQGLIDKLRIKEESAKLEILFESLREVLDEGHKVLVFSQFTSFLSIVRHHLDAEGIRYQYLDGQTRNRKEKVDIFQNDKSYPLFLISLKAGGLGLNLTAAEYVFILDPWWNPAVEAQAIDRSHRIGQTRRVFAYRLICRNTVEEKVLELQKNKKKLADSILSADGSIMKNLSRNDLEFLLS